MSPFSLYSAGTLQYESPLLIGIDKWSLEKLLNEPFFWYSEPFLKTAAQGFIKPGTCIKSNFPLLLLVDTEPFIALDEIFFPLRKKIFYAESWKNGCCFFATCCSDIFLFSGNSIECIKRNYEMLEKAPDIQHY